MKKWKVSTWLLLTLLFVLLPITITFGQRLLTVRTILNRVYDRDNTRLMVSTWAGPSAQATFLTEEEIFNKVFDITGNFLNTNAAGGAGSTDFADLTAGTNVNQAFTLGNGSSLTATGTGSNLATGATANPNNCSAGLLAAGVDAAFVAEGCTDVATQAELDTHAALVNGHSATASNTASRIVQRDGSGNFAAGTITANLTGTSTGTTANAVTFAMMQDIPTLTLMGNSTGSTADPEALTPGTTKAMLALNLVDNTSDATKNAAVRTETNGIYVPRLLDATDASPITVDCSLYDLVRIDELSQATTFNAPSVCTPHEGQKLTFMVHSTVARALTFVTTTGGFSNGFGIALPSTTYADTWHIYGYTWNSILARWVLTGTPQTTSYGTLGQCYMSNGPGVEPTFQACGGGGGGSVGYLQLRARDATLPTTDAATIDGSENNTRLLYDADTVKCAWWEINMPGDYSSAPVLKWPYSMVSGNSGSLVIDVYVTAITPGDTADVNALSRGTVNTCTDAGVPATPGFLDLISCALTNTDSLAAGDTVRLEVCGNTSGTATGLMELVGVARLDYTK